MWHQGKPIPSKTKNWPPEAYALLYSNMKQ